MRFDEESFGNLDLSTPTDGLCNASADAISYYAYVLLSELSAGATDGMRWGNDMDDTTWDFLSRNQDTTTLFLLNFKSHRLL